jgi:hypothetical protein
MLKNKLFKMAYSRTMSVRPPRPVQLNKNNLDSCSYREIKKDLLDLLDRKNENHLFVDKSTVNPLPILVSESQVKEYANIQEALSVAIKTIVSNYFIDDRIKLQYDLDEKVKGILEMYKNKAYSKIGSYRLRLI